MSVGELRDAVSPSSLQALVVAQGLVALAPSGFVPAGGSLVPTGQVLSALCSCRAESGTCGPMGDFFPNSPSKSFCFAV